jgi:hypothetical protein
MNNLQRQSSTVSLRQGGFGKYVLSFRLFCIGTILLYVDFVRNAIDMYGLIVPPPVRIVSILAGPLFMGFSVAVALTEGQLKRLKATYRSWLLFLLLTLPFLFVIGALIFGNEKDIVMLDFLLFPTIFAGILAGTKEENWIFFDKLIMAIFVVGLFCCILWLGDLLVAARISVRADRFDIVRGSIQTFSCLAMLYSFWGTLGTWPYLLLTIKERGVFSKGVIFLGTLVFFIMAIIYQKRFSFVSLTLFFFLIAIKSNIRQLFKMVVILLAVGILSSIAFTFIVGQEAPEYLMKLDRRFHLRGSLWETLIAEDRISYDSKLVFTQFSRLEFVMGRGLGGVVHDISNLYPWEMTHSLHNGSALILLKGGIVLLIIWTVGWLFVVKDFIANRNPMLNRYYIPILMVFLTSWLGVFLSRGVFFAFLMMCAGRIMSRDIKSSRKPLG